MSAERHLLKEALVHVPFFGNNTGARCLYYLCFDTSLTTRAIYLVFADLAFSGVKSLSRNIISHVPHIFTAFFCFFFYGFSF
jgi:hypothetical protein